ncbi:MAG TPA: gliding motility protein [Polyangia bacterium]|nr:gliding motility protein [Polyangia bacterium]
MQIDFENREIQLKVVYYGPALSGKTTNLVALHRRTPPGARGRLMTLDTRDDRTLFFDLLPMRFTSDSGLSFAIKLFTVPGQVIHDATRRLVLQGADAVVFVADSQVAETQANRDSFLDLKRNLAANGLDLKAIPVVIQFNKRDLPGIRTDGEIDDLSARGREPVFKAVATRGDGVVETLFGALSLTWARLDAWHDLEGKFQVRGEELMLSLERLLLPQDGG